MNPARIVVATLNMRLRPDDRGGAFEDPLDAHLQELGLGLIVGGGTAIKQNGEVNYADIEIELANDTAESLQQVIDYLVKLGAAKGSILRVGPEHTIPFGNFEGLAIYLNGTDLPEEVYANSDVNLVYSTLDAAVEGMGMVYSYWEGPTETALYLYGTSFANMQAAIHDFVSTYPLCQQCRIEQIA